MPLLTFLRFCGFCNGSVKKVTLFSHNYLTKIPHLHIIICVPYKLSLYAPTGVGHIVRLCNIFLISPLLSFKLLLQQFKTQQIAWFAVWPNSQVELGIFFCIKKPESVLLRTPQVLFFRLSEYFSIYHESNERYKEQHALPSPHTYQAIP